MEVSSWYKSKECEKLRPLRPEPLYYISRRPGSSGGDTGCD